MTTRSDERIENADADGTTSPDEDEVRSKPIRKVETHEIAPVVKIDEVTLEKDVTIVVAGKSGSGKSTLINNIIQDEDEDKVIPLSLKPITTEYRDKQITVKNGVTVRIVDTPGLITEDMLKQLKKLSKHTKSKADLLVYCIPIRPGAKFVEDGNPKLMKALQDTYGKVIWNHCVVALTYSNTVLDHCNQAFNNTTEATRTYLEYINECTTLFQNTLTDQLKVEDIEVKCITMKEEITLMEAYAGNSTATDKSNSEEKSTATNKSNAKDSSKVTDKSDSTATDKSRARKTTNITAVPAGYKKEDAIHPGTGITRYWTETIYLEMLKKCKNSSKTALLQYRYGRNRMINALRKHGVLVGTTGGTAGIIIGAGVGAGAGAVAGPVGVAAGGLVGAAAGIVAAVFFGAGTTGVSSIGGYTSKKDPPVAN